MPAAKMPVITAVLLYPYGIMSAWALRFILYLGHPNLFKTSSKVKLGALLRLPVVMVTIIHNTDIEPML